MWAGLKSWWMSKNAASHKWARYERVLNIIQTVAEVRGAHMGYPYHVEDRYYGEEPLRLIVVTLGRACVTVSPHEIQMNTNEELLVDLIEEKLRSLEDAYDRERRGRDYLLFCGVRAYYDAD